MIAHECGHLKCEHAVWLNCANLLMLSASDALPGGVGILLEFGLLRWHRAAELSADRAALVVSRDHRVVVSTLMKLAGGSAKMAGELNAEAFLAQARAYDDAAASSLLRACPRLSPTTDSSLLACSASTASTRVLSNL